MDYILVGIGGIFGSITRYSLGRYISKRSRSAFPAGTFIINVTGAFMLGILSIFPNSNNVFLFFGEGFLGAYTTFSTFMYESVNLFSNNKKLNSISYIGFSLIIGIGGFLLGSKMGQIFR